MKKDINEILQLAISSKYWTEIERTIDNWNDNVDSDYERLVERSANLWFIAENVINEYAKAHDVTFSDKEIESICYRIENYLGLWMMVFDGDVASEDAPAEIAAGVEAFARKG